MKIAICISGVPRSGIGDDENKNLDFNRNITNLKRNFPAADIYIGTWKQHESVFIDYPRLAEYPHWVFDEPQVHYHPYFDMQRDDMISEKMKAMADVYRKTTHLHERTRHQAHQILCHANMINHLPEKYDIIIRARFDTFVYTRASFEKYVNDTYQNKTVVGFATLRGHRTTFNINREMNKNDPVQCDGAVGLHNNREKYLFDNLIIHHGDCIDTKRVFDLYEHKKLCPAEFGWYQILSQPYNDNHRCISGWVTADRLVPENFLKEELTG